MIGEELDRKPPEFIPSTEVGIIFGISECVYHDPTVIEDYLRSEYKNARTRTIQDAAGKQVHSPYTYSLTKLGVDLGIIHTSLQLTSRFQAAIGRMTDDKQWNKIRHAHQMERFDAVQNDIFDYLAPNILPLVNDGSMPHLLKSILRDAEFYAAQYDPNRL